MKKISTLFKKDPNNLGRVINEINEENKWVINGEGIATRKFDGTSSAIIEGEIYKRYDAKKGKKAPLGAIPCQEADMITGHHPHWVKCDRNKSEDKYFFEAFDKLKDKKDGTYELCGIKIKNNPEKIDGHQLIRHGEEVLELSSFNFDYLKNYLSDSSNEIEGIVFHHKFDERMCKLRKSDFGIERNTTKN
jgi:hypothetical protein